MSMTSNINITSYSRIAAISVEPGEVLAGRTSSNSELITIGKVLWIEPDMLGTERTFFIGKDNGEAFPFSVANDTQVWIVD